MLITYDAYLQKQSSSESEMIQPQMIDQYVNMLYYALTAWGLVSLVLSSIWLGVVRTRLLGRMHHVHTMIVVARWKSRRKLAQQLSLFAPARPPPASPVNTAAVNRGFGAAASVGSGACHAEGPGPPQDGAQWWCYGGSRAGSRKGGALG